MMTARSAGCCSSARLFSTGRPAISPPLRLTRWMSPWKPPASRLRVTASPTEPGRALAPIATTDRGAIILSRLRVDIVSSRRRQSRQSHGSESRHGQGRHRRSRVASRSHPATVQFARPRSFPREGAGGRGRRLHRRLGRGRRRSDTAGRHAARRGAGAARGQAGARLHPPSLRASARQRAAAAARHVAARPHGAADRRRFPRRLPVRAQPAARLFLDRGAYRGRGIADRRLGRHVGPARHLPVRLVADLRPLPGCSTAWPGSRSRCALLR